MFNKDLILYYLNEKNWSRYRLCKEAHLAQSTLSDILSGKNANPRMDTIEKIANALGINASEFFDQGTPIGKDDIENWDKSIQPDYVDDEGNVCEFKSAESAMQFILSQPSIMAYGGFDINKLSNQDKIDFANDLLSQLKLLGLKYNR